MSKAFTDGAAASFGDLEGKAVLVTGGGSGIGAALVMAFAAQGARVCFLDIAVAASEALVERVAASAVRPVFIACDLTRPGEVFGAVDRARTLVGPVDVLVNNAANDQRHKLSDLTPEQWDRILATNLSHQFLVAQRVLPDMQARGEGAIVNMTSTSFMVGVGGMPAYTAAKAGIIGLTRSIARDYGPFGIRCNAVAPGWIMTDRQRTLWLTPESERRLLEDQCIKATLEPEDMAPVVLFLASRASASITGQTIIADAGVL